MDSVSFYYAGFNTTELFSSNGNIIYTIDAFSKVPFPEATDFQIGWSYFLLWRKGELSICRKFGPNDADRNSQPLLLRIPDKPLDSCKLAAPGRDNVVILTKDNEIWQYKIYENSWKKIINFLIQDSSSEKEYPTKIIQGGCTVILTNLGRAYNVPTLVHMPKRIKFIDIACGFDHTLFLAENGNIYSMGMGTRGQLGHGDLEDCDNPKLIEALAGIKVVHISAAGWHSAVVTDQGDLYTWGWNNNGELGLTSKLSKVVALPTLVDFMDEQDETVETVVKKAECGSTFTICITDDGAFWGSGSNKYGQLGQPCESLPSSQKFIKLQVPINHANVKDFKCNEWGTVLKAD